MTTVPMLGRGCFQYCFGWLANPGIIKAPGWDDVLPLKRGLLGVADVLFFTLEKTLRIRLSE